MPEWLLYISKENLLYPCPELEKIFQNEHEDNFSKKAKNS